jgi:hypothetical protein
VYIGSLLWRGCFAWVRGFPDRGDYALEWFPVIKRRRI